MPTPTSAFPDDSAARASEWLDYVAPRLLGRDYPERASEAHVRPSRAYPVGCIHPIIRPPPDLTIMEEQDIHSVGIRFVTAAIAPVARIGVGFTLFRPRDQAIGAPAPYARTGDAAPPQPSLSEEQEIPAAALEDSATDEESENRREDSEGAADPRDSGDGRAYERAVHWAPERVDLDELRVEFPDGVEWVEAAGVNDAIRAQVADIEARHRADPRAIPAEAPSPLWCMKVFTRRVRVDRGWLCEILLTNAITVGFDDKTPTGQTPVRLELHEWAAFDCRLELRTDHGIEPVPAPGFTQWDPTFSAEVYAQGINCNVDTSSAPAGVLRIDTLPSTRKPLLAHRHHLPISDAPFPSFEALSEGTPALHALEAVLHELEKYRERAVSLYPGFDPRHVDHEVVTFREGLAALREDPQILLAFTLVNRTFSRAHGARGISAWRPFQLGGLVAECRHLRGGGAGGAPAPPVTVVQMSTGGGKTELYLAICVLWAFHLRAHGERGGCVAWATFPLRLLSLQQAERFLVVLSAANEVLAECAAIPGPSREVPFSVGYYAGGSNSANTLWTGSVAPELESEPTELLPRFREAAKEAAFPPPDPAAPLALSLGQDVLKLNRKVVRCPRCLRAGRKSVVRTRLDGRAGAFAHECADATCHYSLPLHVSDAEVLRRQPTIVVGTLDKLARLCTHQDDLLLYGFARAECPTHGYCVKPGVRCRVLGCDQVTRALPAPLRGPRVLIQDELHLVKQDFGALAAPYERMRARVLEKNNCRAPRIVCSTATITGYEKHVNELYGRTAVERLPAAGPEHGESFHTYRTSRTHRVFVGLLPTKVTTQRLVERVTELHLRWVQEHRGRPGWFQTHSDVACLLVYCLAKAKLQRHKASVLQELNRHTLPLLGVEPVGEDRMLELSGDTDADAVASALERLENPHEEDYVRLLYATSMISHGVDLESLNVMLVDGVPNGVDEHIQATSRVGRGRHAGLVCCVYNRMSLRELSLYPYHGIHHAMLEARVPPTNIESKSHKAWEIAAVGFLMFLVHRARVLRSLPPPTRQEAARAIADNHAAFLRELSEFVGAALTEAEVRAILARAKARLESDETRGKPPFVALRLLTSLRDLPAGIAVFPMAR